MKYKVGDILLLYSGEDVYVYSVNNQSKTYTVVNNADENDTKEIKESEVYDKLMSI